MDTRADLQNVINGQKFILEGNQNITKTILGDLLKIRSDIDIDQVFEAIDVSKNGSIDADEWENLLMMINSFDQMDKDKSGSLSLGEIRDYFTNKENRTIMEADVADGKVTLTEFIISMMKKVGSENKTRMELAFANYGPIKEYLNAKAGHGVISKETLKSVYSGVSSVIDVDMLLGDKDGLTYDEERKLLCVLGWFMTLDTDRSWFITEKEIIDILAVTNPSQSNADQFLKLTTMDKNNDAKISFEEFYQACVKYGSS